ncbi:SH3 domain-containing protein [Pseudooceanicola sp. C21-150M6]|uniref:SH3 domain-containing protein n=1 Tax=Pseudooceanicola sp. C21-150M6 TaxID=3434355 RepID=UPI003D7F4139
MKNIRISGLVLALSMLGSYGLANPTDEAISSISPPAIIPPALLTEASASVPVPSPQPEPAQQTVLASGEEADPADDPADVHPETALTGSEGIGPVTKLPLPRYVSLKASKGNVRRGPSRTHRIDWVFTRRNMPLQVTAEYGHWRRVQDQEGVGGWIHHSLISGVRTVLIRTDMLEMHVRPQQISATTAKLELGVIARLDRCMPEWCRVSVAGYKGWIPRDTIWGVDPTETVD